MQIQLQAEPEKVPKCNKHHKIQFDYEQLIMGKYWKNQVLQFKYLHENDRW